MKGPAVAEDKSTPVVVVPKDAPAKPEGPWKHRDGCMNPNSTDWQCPCGVEAIKD